MVVSNPLDTKLASLTFPFYLTIWEAGQTPDTASQLEIVEVTARPSANNYSVTRAQQSTSNVPHTAGDNVGLFWTKSHSDEIWGTSTWNLQDIQTLLKSGTSSDVLHGGSSPFMGKIKFGGSGSDGALAISSGTTTIDLGGLTYVEKNYTSISITGTAKLAFTNSHANGTIIALRSQGDVTITSSTVPAIDCSGLGANGGAAGADGLDGVSNILIGVNHGHAGINATSSIAGVALGPSLVSVGSSHIPLFVGAGGGGGSTAAGSTARGGAGAASALSSGSVGLSQSSGGTAGSAGAGGKGGGSLYIECGGAYNCTSTLTVAGIVGADSTSTPNNFAGGGGGGAGGSIVVLYNSLTANTGTYTVSGGAGGSATGGATGGAGAAGFSIVKLNLYFA
jgi:hypothetical protein